MENSLEARLADAAGPPLSCASESLSQATSQGDSVLLSCVGEAACDMKCVKIGVGDGD